MIKKKMLDVLFSAIFLYLKKTRNIKIKLIKIELNKNKSS